MTTRMRNSRRLGGSSPTAVTIAALLICLSPLVAGCSAVPADLAPKPSSAQSKGLQTPSQTEVTATAMPTATVTVTASPTLAQPDPHPTLLMDCSTPPTLVPDDLLGGLAYLFDPRAQMDFSGTAATVSETVDGFKSRVVTVTRKPAYRRLEPVDLTNVFRNTSPGRKTHKVFVVLRDGSGRTTTYRCSFPLPW